MHLHESFVVSYNNSAAAYPSDRTIVGLFEDQVRRTPEQQAIKLGDRSLTYRALNERANQTARRLEELGAGPGRLVVLFMDHSIEVVCAIAAVLKTGAAYVPIDPSTPKERLAGIMADIAAGQNGTFPVVITQSALLPRTPAGTTTLLLDTGAWPLASYPADDRPSPATPGGLAYVIFTSGSTGTPKGVMIEHRSLVNYIWWAREMYAHQEALTWPLFSSLAFDLTVTSIFTPLITGGRIIVYAAEPGLQATLILKVVEDGLADVVKLTPAHLAMIKDMDLAATRIRVLVVGGEDFKTALARDIAGRFARPVDICNEYGPTEATVGCMIHRFNPHSDTGASVPIGVPAANAGIFILDPALTPVPTETIGEMYLAGDGLARGYFNRPDLTAAAFVTGPDPKGTGTAIRLYKTGDLARWSADGRMEFLGRSDHQVKIGGYRIELSEIEAHMLTFAGIRESVATVAGSAVPDGAPDIGRLVGYYVSEHPLDEAALSAHLARVLPHYMVPSQFVRLEALPLTSNGKVDRGRLPAAGASVRKAASAPPQTEMERALFAIWGELLASEEFGIHCDFFDLGGHSLLAIKAASRIREVFNVELKIQTIFEHSTIATLSSVVKEALQQNLPRPASPIVRQARRAVARPS